MPQRFPVLATLALFSCLASPSAATVVPDNYPTIQAAIDAAPDGDQILVRDGTYAESVTLHDGITLAPIPVNFDGELSPTSQSYPRVLGSVQVLGGTLRGFHVMGRAAVGGFGGRSNTIITECLIDSGIVAGGHPLLLSIRGCIVHGGIRANAEYGEITNNTVLGGGIIFVAMGCCGHVKGNYVVGPAAVGVSVTTIGNSDGIVDNTIVGCDIGIVTVWDVPPIRHNTVTDCHSAGIRIQFPGDSPGPATVQGNVIQRCGGNGLEFHDLHPTVTDNTVTDVGGCGIWADPGGAISSIPTVGVFQGNHILRGASDGMHIQVPAEIASNIVGRSGARGIVVLPTGTAINVHGNTSYWNARAGFDLTSDASGTVANNVAYANQREGLVWSGAPVPTLTCNDWYANVSGGTSGVLPGATDLATDPFFCNVPQDDVHIAVFSPLRNTPGCGLIGALDVGCSEPTAVADPPRTAVKFGCTPRPTTGELRFSWPRLEAAGQLEVFDATGARRWRQSVDKGSESQNWKTSDDSGRRLPAGVYFARIKAGSYDATTRVVVLN